MSIKFNNTYLIIVILKAINVFYSFIAWKSASCYHQSYFFLSDNKFQIEMMILCIYAHILIHYKNVMLRQNKSLLYETNWKRGSLFDIRLDVPWYLLEILFKCKFNFASIVQEKHSLLYGMCCINSFIWIKMARKP